MLSVLLVLLIERKSFNALYVQPHDSTIALLKVQRHKKE
jgi:hypothetical protein